MCLHLMIDILKDVTMKCNYTITQQLQIFRYKVGQNCVKICAKISVKIQVHLVKQVKSDLLH
jgi:hypothetical protein